VAKKIKVLHIINSLALGGAETLLADLIARMDRTRFDNHVAHLLSPDHSGQATIKAGVPIYDLSRNGKPNPLMLLKLSRLIDQMKPDIVHTHAVQSDLVGHMACMLKGIRNRVSSQHSAFHPKNGTLIYRIARSLTHHAAAVIAVNDYCRDYLVRVMGYAPDIIRVITNGIDLKKFPPREPPRENSPTLRVGTLGRLHPQKGLTTLVEAMAEVAGKIKIQCFIPGSGEQEPLLRDMVRKNKLKDILSFPGPLTGIPKIEYLHQLDIFLQPSHWELFGISILEAMAVGLPVIASNLEGIPALVENGRTGILVEPKNPSALAQAVIELGKDLPRRRRYGENARQRAKLFTIERTVAGLEKIYTELVAGI